MADLPPPKGYESWLDWLMDAMPEPGDMQKHAACCKELAILRAKAEAWEAVEQFAEAFQSTLNDHLAAIEKEYQ